MNTYDELKTLYDKLLLENERLRFENGVFRDRLRDLNVDIESLLAVNEDSLLVLAEGRNTQETLAAVNMQSSKEDKITLFRSLFKGRDDVFARRWYSAKTGKSGYQPVCLNEWNSYLCDKKKYKCATCPHRKLKSISDEVIENHLRGKDSQGKDVLGIYPMLKDEACHFLALDFDDAEYEKDVLAFKGVAQEHGIPVYIERSRSGNGAHVWIFFAECVPSYLARKLGSGLLTFAMSSRSDIKFDSYDRLFPNQDNMPHGGFGNLIALPLQGLARKNGNSVFVDDDFAPIKDQWAYLSEAKKITLVEVEGKVAVLCVNSDLGELVTADEESENKKPWQNARKTVISKEDFTCSEVEIVEAGTIYIGKAGLSQKVQTQIKRLVSFRNPDFYKSQAMRLPIYNKPRIITLAEDYGDYISIPRGGKELLICMLENADVSYKIVDERNFGKEIQAEFKGKLREKQSLAVNALLAHDTGVLSATTAFGKTVVSANIIAKHKTNTLVLVHTQSLLSQWQKSLEEFLILQQPEIDVEDQPKKRGRKKQLSPVGILGGGKNTLNGKVDVAIMQSLFEGGEVKELVRNYGQIIVDECHHVSAVNFEKILKCVSARYVYGLTATPTRQDGHHPIIFLQCGDIRYRVDAKTEAGNRPFEHYISPRFTKLKVTAIKDEKQISQIYNDIAKNSERNKMIVGDVVSALGNGRTPLVLTERVGHVELLSELLKDKCENIVKLVGTMSAKEKRLASEKLAEYKDCDSLVIIATGKYVGEGFDFPRLDTLFLAMPIAWKGKVAQYAGRLHRLLDNKKDVVIYDYADIHVPVLERMYHKRVKSYAEIGYKILGCEGVENNPNIIYNTENYSKVFYEDIRKANREIVVFAPSLKKDRIIDIAKEFAIAMLNGTVVTIITTQTESFKLEMKEAVSRNIEHLQNFGIKVIQKEKVHQNFAVIDDKITWYGNINFMGFATDEEITIRIDDVDISSEFIKMV